MRNCQEIKKVAAVLQQQHQWENIGVKTGIILSRRGWTNQRQEYERMLCQRWQLIVNEVKTIKRGAQIQLKHDNSNRKLMRNEYRK